MNLKFLIYSRSLEQENFQHYFIMSLMEYRTEGGRSAFHWSEEEPVGLGQRLDPNILKNIRENFCKEKL